MFLGTKKIQLPERSPNHTKHLYETFSKNILYFIIVILTEGRPQLDISLTQDSSP